MNRRELIFTMLKGFSAWLVLSALLGYFGDALMTVLFPLLKATMIMMSPELFPSLALVKSAHASFDYSIELSAWALHPIYLNAGQYMPTGADFKVSAHLLHALVPLVIEGTILCVWPVHCLRRRLLLIALGLPMAALVIMATLPAQLLGKLEISFQNIALAGQNPRPIPWFVDWMVFCEMGGRWLLGIAAAWLCIQLQRQLPCKH